MRKSNNKIKGCIENNEEKLKLYCLQVNPGNRKWRR